MEAGRTRHHLWRKPGVPCGRVGHYGCVRGRGLMIGIEIVRDQRTKKKAADLRNLIVDLAFHKGLLVLGAGENTIRLSPPLLIDQEQADFAARTLEDCFREAGKKI